MLRSSFSQTGYRCSRGSRQNSHTLYLTDQLPFLASSSSVRVFTSVLGSSRVCPSSEPRSNLVACVQSCHDIGQDGCRISKFFYFNTAPRDCAMKPSIASYLQAWWLITSGLDRLLSWNTRNYLQKHSITLGTFGQLLQKILRASIIPRCCR